jgi:hypothetical protein
MGSKAEPQREHARASIPNYAQRLRRASISSNQARWAESLTARSWAP